MAVAGCPDYFLHHPNYQVSGLLLFDFLYVIIIVNIIDFGFSFFFGFLYYYLVVHKV